MQTRADRDFYRQQRADIARLEQLGVHARRVHVRGAPGQNVRVGSCYEEGWPESVQSACWLQSEAIELIDESGRSWMLEKGASLYISGAHGIRTKLLDENEVWDFAITSDQLFYMLVTDEGPHKVQQRGVFGSVFRSFYQLAPNLEDFDCKVSPRGAFPAWVMLFLTPILIGVARYFMPWDEASQFGLLTLYTTFMVFVCLDGDIFGANWLPRHRPTESGQRWRPELRG